MKSICNSVRRTGYSATFSILLLFSAVFSEPIRVRRQSSPNYLIDLLVVVDDALFSRFQQWVVESSSGQVMGSSPDVNGKLKEYVSLVVHQANDRLATLNQSLDYSISLQIVNMYINVNILGNSVKNQADEIPSENALGFFKNWIYSNGYGNMYDHAVLLTGHKLKSDTSASGEVVRGRAYTGKMCDTTGLSTSVIQEYGGFQSVLYLTHEVAHSLGSDHDGVTQNCIQDRYIMSADIGLQLTQENLLHPWYFSSCSATSINTLVERITSSSASDSSDQSNCLGSNSDPIPEFIATSESVSGQLYSADVQCQMIHGNKSRVCLGGAFTDLDQICTSMFCLNLTSLEQGSVCTQYFAAEGTTCGDKKWCRLGRCVTSDAAPSKDTSKCPNGDSLSKVNGQECSVAVRNTPWVCYDETIRTQTCCQSCEDVRKNSSVCPYGDKQLGCVKTSCTVGDVLVRNYAESCCGTCSYDVMSPCVDVSSIDGVTCKERVAKDGQQECYDSRIANSCCQTCSTYRTNLTGCEYGDYYLGDTCQSCGNNDFECCSSCRNYNTGAIILWTSMPISVFLVLWTAGVMLCETAF